MPKCLAGILKVTTCAPNSCICLELARDFGAMLLEPSHKSMSRTVGLN